MSHLRIHLLAWIVVFTGCCLTAAPIRVLIWDEQQPQQRMSYSNWLGGQIADHLRTRPGLTVTTARLNDPEQGLSAAALDACDVLVWWGHVRNGEVSPATGREIVRRIKSGKLALIALHSAHWSAPFMEAMNERAREDALKVLPPAERATAVLLETNLFANLRTAPKYTDRVTPSVIYRKPVAGPVRIELTLPNCCFPAYRPDAMPSHVRVLLPKHPIAKGLPAEFTIAQTEMYDEPFHVPPPDEVVLEERWERGEWFRSGSVWHVGQGKVFYFRPGHEIYPVFKNPDALRVIENAVRWLGPGR
jgi:trehalose utilization protein